MFVMERPDKDGFSHQLCCDVLNKGKFATKWKLIAVVHLSKGRNSYEKVSNPKDDDKVSMPKRVFVGVLTENIARKHGLTPHCHLEKVLKNVAQVSLESRSLVR